MKTSPNLIIDISVEAIPADIKAAYFGEGQITASILGSGIINDTYLITEVTGQKSVLQRLNHIFDKSLIGDFTKVTEHLRKNDWEVPRLLTTQHGEVHLHDAQGYLWRLMTYVECDDKIADLNKSVAEGVGSLLAQLHQCLATLPYSPKNVIPNFHDLSYYSQYLQQLIPELPVDGQHLARKVLAAHRSLPHLPMLPPQLVHGDPRLDNILFKNSKPHTFIDLDTIMLGSPWIDVGDMLRDVAQQSLAHHRKIHLRATIEGYREVAYPQIDSFTFLEQAITAMRQISLELAMRFLIDIIDDSYFNWDESAFSSRKAHNLYRAQEQWRIYQLAIN